MAYLFHFQVFNKKHSAFHSFSYLSHKIKKVWKKTLLGRVNISNIIRNITYYSLLNVHCSTEFQNSGFDHQEKSIN